MDRDEEGIDRIREPLPAALIPLMQAFTSVVNQEGIDLNAQVCRARLGCG